MTKNVPGRISSVKSPPAAKKGEKFPRRWTAFIISMISPFYLADGLINLNASYNNMFLFSMLRCDLWCSVNRLMLECLSLSTTSFFPCHPPSLTPPPMSSSDTKSLSLSVTAETLKDMHHVKGALDDSLFRPISL